MQRGPLGRAASPGQRRPSCCRGPSRASSCSASAPRRGAPRGICTLSGRRPATRSSAWAGRTSCATSRWTRRPCRASTPSCTPRARRRTRRDGGSTSRTGALTVRCTWVNEVRLQAGVRWELSDGDALTFGGHPAPGSPEFYFLFQKVKVRPLDFDAITVPKAGAFSSDLQNRIRTNPEREAAAAAACVNPNKLSLNRSTVILDSIGSLSKMKGSAWTFRRSRWHEGAASDPGSSSSPPRPPPPPPPPPPSSSPAASSSSLPPKSLAPASRSRRKSAHTVLLEDGSSDESPSGTGPEEEATPRRGGKKRRLYKSDSEALRSPPPSRPRPREAEPFPVGIRTIGSFHGAVTNARLDHRRRVFPPPPRQGRLRDVAAFCQQRAAAGGRRRAHGLPVFSPLVVGGESYNPASPSARVCAAPRGRAAFNGFRQQPSKRRGRPRKHPLPPRPSLPSPSSSSSSSTSSGSSSSGSSSDEDDDAEEATPAGGSGEPCAAPRCLLPQQDPVQWIQCDVCDAWYHIDCLRVDRKKLLRDPNADFHCGRC
ncbi:serine/arginine repetitive matrix protein 1 isoform X2 [Phyllopteryx taeniolatus]|uniref:serine/arginine repetitive matrix protein 1 isoform X2 n=1 Tax=Phyllopteryx taeniolatus TaxID=161469 RepID=UPI002AD3025E|nr:serine/arginine repetitive matrix protein 1 isoform X2 [Phyllopteryx taeniolatus]